MNKTNKIGCVLTCCLIICFAFIRCGYRSGSVLYDNSDNYIAGNAEITNKIDSIEINWNCGNIHLTEQEKQTISFSETAEDALKEDESLRYLVDGSTLTIQYCSPKWLGSSTKKTLDLALPKNSVLKNLTINGTSAETVLKLPSITAESIAVNSTSGDIDLLIKHCGDLTAAATSGRITGQCDTLSKGNLSNTSGSVELNLKHNADALTIECTSGDITLTLPDNADFAGAIESNSGEFACDFPTVIKNDQVLCGSGKMKLKLNTTSGNIFLNCTH